MPAKGGLGRAESADARDTCTRATPSSPQQLPFKYEKMLPKRISSIVAVRPSAPAADDSEDSRQDDARRGRGDTDADEAVLNDAVFDERLQRLGLPEVGRHLEGRGNV